MDPALINTWTPAVNVLTWFLMVTAILSLLTRLGTKYWIFRKLTVDDHLSIASLVFCIAQSIAVSLATANGYGQHFHHLPHSSVDNMMKSQYAANLLFILSMCCSKLAIIIFIRSLTPVNLDLRVAIGLGVFVLMWAISGIFTSAFQCAMPRTWDYLLHGQCFDLAAWWNYLGVANIASEIGIIAQAMLVIVRIQANMHKKLVLASVFTLRVLVIVAVICQLVYAAKTANSKDITFDTWPVTVSTEFAQSLSVVTACSPQFKPFLDSLRSSGMTLNGMSSYHGTRKGYGYNSYNKSTTRAHTRNARDDRHELMSVPVDPGVHSTVVTGSPDWEADSQSSQSRIIRETRTWTVTQARRDTP